MISLVINDNNFVLNNDRIKQYEHLHNTEGSSKFSLFVTVLLDVA